MEGGLDMVGAHYQRGKGEFGLGGEGRSKVSMPSTLPMFEAINFEVRF